MRVAPDWKDYRVIATGDGEKLEKWGEYTLLRPDPQVIWHAAKPLRNYKGIDAVYERSSTGGGRWKYYGNVPEDFVIGWRGLKFKLKLMGFKHTGLFPEQAVNWDRMSQLIKGANREINVLNLFGYTGAASVACLAAGAKVCHVDSAKAMVERAGENVRLSGLDNSGMRYIIDDCFKISRCENLKQSSSWDSAKLFLSSPVFVVEPERAEQFQRTDAIAVPCETAPFGNNRNGERETRTVKGLPEGTHNNFFLFRRNNTANFCASLRANL